MSLFAIGWVLVAGSGATAATPIHSPTPDAFITEWLTVGPFPNGSASDRATDFESARETDFLVEKGRDGSFDPSEGETHLRADQTYTWRAITSPTDAIDLTETYGPLEDVTVYAWTRVEVDVETQAVLALGSDDGIKVWLNGELIHDRWVGRGLRVDEDIVHATFKPGRNSLLLKVANGAAGWGFAARFLGPDTATSALFRASDSEAIRALVEIGADLGTTDDDRRTPLHAASERGEKDAIDALIGLGASVSAVDLRGYTPLHYAAYGGHLHSVSTLIAHGAPVDATALGNLTPHHLSRRAGYPDVTKLLAEGGADGDVQAGSKRDQVDALFVREARGDTPGAAVLVSQGDQVLLEVAYGMANLEHDIPLAPDMKFRLGSVTKQFTAVGILLLQKAGQLSVDDPLARFLPEFPRGDEITLRHLLTHTAGLLNYTDVPEFWRKSRLALTHDELTAFFRDAPLTFDPGTQWSYSNSGYYVLGMVIEEVAGMTYEEFMQSRIFGPLGLDDTGYDRHAAILERRVSGYERAEGAYRNAAFLDMSPPFAAGALYSTVGDLHTWNRAIMHGQIVEEEVMDRAFTPARLADGSDTTYGFGWSIDEVRGLKRIGHGGGINGFNTSISYHPSLDATIIVLSNGDVPAGRIAREVTEIYFHEEMTARER